MSKHVYIHVTAVEPSVSGALSTEASSMSPSPAQHMLDGGEPRAASCTLAGARVACSNDVVCAGSRREDSLPTTISVTHCGRTSWSERAHKMFAKVHGFRAKTVPWNVAAWCAESMHMSSCGKDAAGTGCKTIASSFNAHLVKMGNRRHGAVGKHWLVLHRPTPLHLKLLHPDVPCTGRNLESNLKQLGCLSVLKTSLTQAGWGRRMGSVIQLKGNWTVRLSALNMHPGDYIADCMYIYVVRPDPIRHLVVTRAGLDCGRILWGVVGKQSKEAQTSDAEATAAYKRGCLDRWTLASQAQQRASLVHKLLQKPTVASHGKARTTRWTPELLAKWRKIFPAKFMASQPACLLRFKRPPAVNVEAGSALHEPVMSQGFLGVPRKNDPRYPEYLRWHAQFESLNETVQAQPAQPKTNSLLGKRKCAIGGRPDHTTMPLSKKVPLPTVGKVWHQWRHGDLDLSAIVAKIHFRGPPLHHTMNK